MKILALASATLHTAMLGHASNAVSAVVLAVMVMTCVYCAYDLYFRTRSRAQLITGTPAR